MAETMAQITDSTFRHFHRGGEEVSRAAREGQAAWEDKNLPSALDSLDGIANDCERVARRAREAIAKIEAKATA